jgi:thioredoxin reductase
VTSWSSPAARSRCQTSSAPASKGRTFERPIRALLGRDGHLEVVELEGGSRFERACLVARPPQRQTALVESLGLALDEQGFVRVDDHKRTSVHGIYAAGDLTTMMQGAIIAAAAGTQAAAMMTHAINFEALAREASAR